MKEALIKLHVAIFLAGTSGLFGKWVTLSETALVWYRAMLSLIILTIVLAITRRLRLIAMDHLLRIGVVGLILVTHWIFFYASIKAANVSVGVVCLSAVAFITALIEPLCTSKAKFSLRDILLSVISVAGIVCIFSFDAQYRLGILYGLISSTLIALLMIANRQLRTLTIKSPSFCKPDEHEGKRYSSWFMFLIQLCVGFVLLSLYILVSTLIGCGGSLADTLSAIRADYTPTQTDWIFLIILAAVVTITPYALKIDSLKYVSAFTVNLANNMEPVYSIILAAVLFNEMEELNAAFFVGVSLIALSVVLQTMTLKKGEMTMGKNLK